MPEVMYGVWVPKMGDKLSSKHPSEQDMVNKYIIDIHLRSEIETSMIRFANSVNSSMPSRLPLEYAIIEGYLPVPEGLLSIFDTDGRKAYIRGVMGYPPLVATSTEGQEVSEWSGWTRISGPTDHLFRYSLWRNDISGESRYRDEGTGRIHVDGDSIDTRVSVTATTYPVGVSSANNYTVMSNTPWVSTTSANNPDNVARGRDILLEAIEASRLRNLAGEVGSFTQEEYSRLSNATHAPDSYVVAPDPTINATATWGTIRNAPMSLMGGPGQVFTLDDLRSPATTRPATSVVEDYGTITLGDSATGLTDNDLTAINRANARARIWGTEHVYDVLNRMDQEVQRVMEENVDHEAVGTSIAAMRLADTSAPATSTDYWSSYGQTVSHMEDLRRRSEERQLAGEWRSMLRESTEN